SDLKRHCAFTNTPAHSPASQTPDHLLVSLVAYSPIVLRAITISSSLHSPKNKRTSRCFPIPSPSTRFPFSIPLTRQSPKNQRMNWGNCIFECAEEVVRIRRVRCLRCDKWTGVGRMEVFPSAEKGASSIESHSRRGGRGDSEMEEGSGHISARSRRRRVCGRESDGRGGYLRSHSSSR
ncbi:hypothetical protein BT69DRAFT_1288642, partial [Atractiella rhizophila]